MSLTYSQTSEQGENNAILVIVWIYLAALVGYGVFD